MTLKTRSQSVISQSQVFLGTSRSNVKLDYEN